MSLLAVGFLPLSNAENLTVKVHPVSIPGESFQLSDLNIDFRFLELSGQGAGATHVLIDGLVPLSDDAPYVLSSGYEAVDIESGDAKDRGIVQLKLPDGADVASDGATSPIVGIVSRSGSWEDHAPTPASGTTVGSSSGLSSYASGPDTLDGTLDIAVERNGEQFSGSVDYTVVDIETIDLDAFSLSGAAVTQNFYPSRLTWDGSRKRFSGELMSADPFSGDFYDSTFFGMELSGISDADHDGIPDIVDSSVEISLEVTAGVWSTDDRIGRFLGLTSSWAHSPRLGFIRPSQFPWVYQAHYGWLRFDRRLPVPNNHIVWFHSPDPEIGWIYLNERDSVQGRFYYGGRNGEWSEGNFKTGPAIDVDGFAGL